MSLEKRSSPLVNKQSLFSVGWAMIKVLLALVCIIILVAPGVTWWVAQRPVPVLDGIGNVNALSKPVLVRYDSRAIPYIKAETEEDLYSAQGYVTARERMFQMDMLRRAAEGRFAQVFGLTALATDRLMRTIGFERLAKEELNYLSPQAKAAVQAYSRGVNAYLQENDDKLPLEFTLLGYKPEPWRDIDSVAVLKYLAYELDESWKLDELRFRVTNNVGDNNADRLFNDNLALSTWSPESQLDSSTPKSALLRPAASAPVKLNPMLPTGTAPVAPGMVAPGTGQPATQPGSAQPAIPQPGLPVAPRRAPESPRAQAPKGLQEKFRQLCAEPEFLRKPQRSWGSTGWVLAPQFSKSGGALLAADKHSALTTPCEFFLVSLSSAGQHTAGASLPGVPGVVFGRNSQIAFASSSMHADVQDLFVEHFVSDVENKYKTLSKIEAAQEFREPIPVRFGNDVEHKVTITKHGPILLRDKDSGIALSWTGFETKKPWMNTICSLNRSSNWNDFIKALSTYGGPPQLFIYADRAGNIGCHAAGILPVRGGGGQGTTMSEGWLAKGEWVASVDFDELPQSFTPAGSAPRASGDFCIAAGQKLYSVPATATRFGQLWGHQWDPPYRANRLALSLPKGKGAPKLDLIDFNAYQGDELNMLAKLVVDELKKSMDANKSIDAVQVKAINLMQHWDYSIKKDSAAASIYESFVGTLARRLIETKLKDTDMTKEYFQNWPLWITFVEDYLRKKPADMLPSEERTHDTFMLTTFAKSNTRLKLLFKNDNVETWAWEKAHPANFKAVGVKGVAWLRNLLDINGIGVGGDSNCLNACDVDRLPIGGPFNCNNGPSVRLLIDMADNDAFYGNLSLGQSGHYFSPFRQDQLKSWLRADPLPIAFSEAQIDKQCRQKYYLSAPGYR